MTFGCAQLSCLWAHTVSWNLLVLCFGVGEQEWGPRACAHVSVCLWVHVCTRGGACLIADTKTFLGGERKPPPRPTFRYLGQRSRSCHSFIQCAFTHPGPPLGRAPGTERGFLPLTKLPQENIQAGFRLQLCRGGCLQLSFAQRQVRLPTSWPRRHHLCRRTLWLPVTPVTVRPVLRAGGSLQGEEGLSPPRVSGFLGIIWRPTQHTGFSFSLVLDAVLPPPTFLLLVSVFVSMPPLSLQPRSSCNTPASYFLPCPSPGRPIPALQCPTKV